MAIVTFTNFISAIVVVYIALALQQLYQLVNPLNGVDNTGDGIEPLWQAKQSYTVLCFLSHARHLKMISVSTMRQKSQILFERDELIHDVDQPEVSLDLIIKSENVNSSSHGVVVTNDIFKVIQRNSSSVYLHAMVYKKGWSSESINDKMIREGRVLHSSVKLIKYDVIPKSFRYRYLLSDFGWAPLSPEEANRATLPSNTVISYWKPEVSVRLVADFAKYPFHVVPEAVSRNIIRTPQPRYKPALYADEIGLTSDKYIHLNETVQELPLKISIGPMSTQRWFLMSHLEESFSAQKGLGFSDKDIDDVRRMITDTSVLYLLVTIIASVLHLLFEFLAFQSDISFWSHNKSLAGLSTRALITDLFSQIIIFLFLLDSDTSLLVIVPSFAAILIQMWKVQKATGLTFTFTRGIEFRRWKAVEPNDGGNDDCDDATGNKVKSSSGGDKPSSNNNTATEPNVRPTPTPSTTSTEEQLAKVSLEADRVATLYLGSALLPVVIIFILRSLIYEKHASWYSWAIGSLTGSVYAFGFVFMCPQLYINHKLKSVSYLPWQYLIYKFLNTFVDDLFAFIIKMPVMHRLSVFRDDIVFLVYLYQRWIYRVDKDRPIEK